MEGEKKFLEKIACGEKDPAKVVDRVYDRFLEDDIDDIVDGGELKHAEFFYSEFKDDIKVVDSHGGYVFNNSTNLYERQTIPFIIHMICTYLDTNIVNLFKDLVSQQKKTEQCSKLMKALKTVRKASHAKAVFELCQGRLYDPSFESKLDKISNLLPIRSNSVIDLKTLKVRKRTRDDMFSFELNVDFLENYDDEDSPNYIPHAKKFFSQVFKGDNQVVKYAQKVFGYCITGETSERAIYIIYGEGSNAKSATFELIKNAIGQFYKPVDRKVMIKDDKVSSSHTAHLIQLMKARLATYSESDDGESLNMTLLKHLRGEEEISARRLYGEQFTFLPHSKYCILTNYKPTFNITDQASIDTIRYIPFEARFVPNPDKKKGEYLKDPQVVENLKTIYLDEIFTWLCIGAYEAYKEIKEKKKIEIPQTLQTKTTKYIDELDITKQFIDNNCIVGNDAKEDRSSLYTAFNSWAIDNGMNVIKRKDFYIRVRKLGYEELKSNGINYVVGLRSINKIEQ